MTEETQQPAVPTARVATRPGTSGVAGTRRRIYQRHLLLFLAVCAGFIAIDQVTSPGVQWAFYPIVPWMLIFVLHTLGLLGRGYSVGELLIPPRQMPVKDVYTVPLDYELVRARQLHDGIVNAAHSVRDQDAELADSAVAAADDLIHAMESLVERAHAEKYRSDDQAKKLVPAAQDALAALDALHRGMLRNLVLEEETPDVPVNTVVEQTVAIRQLAS